MAITVEKARVIPEIRYDHVWVEKFTLTQKQVSENPVYSIQADIIMYAVLEDGKYKFDPASQQQVTIEDVEASALIEAQKGEGTPLLNAMASFEQSVGFLIESQVDSGLVTVQTKASL